MAFFEITSDNPKFSYVLRKNPESGMMAKRIRKGTGYGFFTRPDVSAYGVFFRDAADEISYPMSQDDKFEYCDVGRYASPIFVLNSLSEFLSSAVKKPAEEDTTGHTHSFTVNLLRVRRKEHLQLFPRYFSPDFDIQIQEFENIPNAVRLTVSTKKTLRELFSLVNLLMVFVAIKNEELESANIEKYLTCLQVVDAPYFVRYVFKVNFLSTVKLLAQYKEILETSSRNKLALEVGTTALSRINFAKKQVDIRKPVVDVGCGEGSYLRDYVSKVPEYVALDIDEECRERVSRRVKHKKYENVIVGTDVPTFLESGGKLDNTNVLLMEVMEHMPMDDAKKLVKLILSGNPYQLILSTPNKDFNKFYIFDDEESRHDDHHFELVESEFQQFVMEMVGETEYQSFIESVGDSVDGIRPTWTAVFRKAKP